MKRLHNTGWIAVLLASGAILCAEAGTIRVAGGEWQTGARISATNFIVDSGARLNGTGTVHSVATIRGEISPGTSVTDVQAFSFSSNLLFDGGTFVCYAATSNSLDLLQVAGDVSGIATVRMSRAVGAIPDQEVIIEGGATSDYSLFSLEPSAGWMLGQSGSLDLWVGSIPSMGVLGTNGAQVAGGEAADLEKGTAFHPSLAGAVITNTLTLTNNGNAVLNILDMETNGADAARFIISSLPASVPIDSAVTFTVEYAPLAPGSHAVALVISNNAPTNNPYTVNLAGSCYAVSTNNGPYAGGNTLTLTNGHFGSITQVLVGATAATIVDSGSSWVTITLPATGSAGIKDISVQTSDNGETVVPAAYTVNPLGAINAVNPVSGSWTGGYPVVISGSNLCNGVDVTNVTLGGVAVASIDSQSATQVVVTAGVSASTGIGQVRVYSVSHGESYNPGVTFEYLREPQTALVFTPATPQTFASTNPLSTTGGTGTGAVSYAVASGPGSIVGGLNLTVTAGSGSIEVVATKAQDEFYFATAATGTVAAIKADQAITFPAIAGQETTNQVGLAASASSGLAVSFAVASGPAAIAGGTNLTFSTSGQVSIAASQAGDANWNPASDVTNTFLVTKAVASVYLQNLAQTYDGTARTVTATTLPAGLTVDITYDGNPTAPTNAGTYAVTGTVNDLMYQGTASDSLVVAKENQTITFTAIADQLTTNELGLAATASSGLPVSFVVASGPAAIAGGTNLSFSTSGQVSIAASQAGDGNWNAAPDVSNIFNVTKAVAPVYLQDLSQVYDGTARVITATTMPAGLTVEFTYDGNDWAPTNAGTYAVTGAVRDLIYQGWTNGPLAVARALDTITFSNTTRGYDGTPREATATADSGSPVALTYDGLPPAPVNLGTYAVTGLVDTVNWAATNTTTLTVVKGDQVITNFLPADDTYFIIGSSTTVSAQASSGLAVGFTNLTPDTAALAGTNITFTNPGVVRVCAFQAGNTNWNATPSVTNEWFVTGLISNVAPAAANVGGGIEVVIQGDSLGDGTNITNVTLAGVEATIVTQSRHEVTVMAEVAPAAVTGDVRVVSTTSGTSSRPDGFEYLWLAAPDQLEPDQVRLTSLRTRWQNSPGATAHLLDVATDMAFTSFVPGYEGRDVGLAETHRVEGLDWATGYATRLFAWNASGFSHASRAIWTVTAADTPGDIDGDGKADLAVYHPASGDWQIRESDSGAVRTPHCGWSTTLPVAADYDGDGLLDVAAYHRYSGNWYILQSSNGLLRVETLGGRTKVPVPGDYDRDGKIDAAAFDQTSGRWEIRGSLAGDYSAQWGFAGWIPVPADYDGDGQTDLAILHPTAGIWFVLHSSTGNSTRWNLGSGRTRPVPADYDGDGRADVAVWEATTGDWRIIPTTDPSTVRQKHVGWATTIPAAADYDGDGIADPTVYYPRRGDWYILQSSDGRVLKLTLGGPDQIPAHLQSIVHSWYDLP